MAVSLGYRNVYRDPYGFPKWQEEGLPVSESPAKITVPPEATQAHVSKSLKGWGMLWTLLGIFAGGLALNLTPCVYPMIPITVSFFGGRTAKDKPGQIKLVFHGLCYLMGLALTNSILGVAAALTGGLMGAMLQNPVVLALIAGVLILFATSLFGLWELRLPGALTQAAGKSYSGYFGSLFMGLTLGVVAAPCIGPFVLGLAYLGGRHGQSVARISDFFCSQPRTWSPAFCVGALFRATATIAKGGRLDALGAQAHGLGSCGDGGLFHTPVASRNTQNHPARQLLLLPPACTSDGSTKTRPVLKPFHGSKPSREPPVLSPRPSGSPHGPCVALE